MSTVSKSDGILKNGLDRSPLPVESPPQIIAIDYANLRGSAYYQ